MSQSSGKHDLSDLERGFEYEFEVADDNDNELESAFEAQRDDEGDEPESELGEDDGSASEAGGSDFADRFLELSQREFEDEDDREREIDGLLGEMERQYFFGKLARAVSGGVKGLVKKGLKVAKGLPAFQVMKGLTDFARKNLRGTLGRLAQAAMKGGLSMIPGASMALPILSQLGFDPSKLIGGEREAWQRFTELAEDAYETLADSMHPGATDPAEAAALAARAYKTAAERVGRRSRRGADAAGRTRRIRLRPGDRLVIEVDG